jgi:putative DNA primase/helicase
MLRGVRLVIAYETEQGRSWAISKLKMMTGGDPISARFMRQDFFTYLPQFKVMILGNHKPALQNVDVAVRRRFHLIPFTVEIRDGEQDKELPEKLKAEYPAILGWMMHGCDEWQRIGLAPPKAVLAATSNYLADEDSVGAWIAEFCVLDPVKYATLGDLFTSWKGWAEANGERPGTRKQLAGLLDAQSGLRRHRQPGTGQTGWHGIAIKQGHEGVHVAD